MATAQTFEVVVAIKALDGLTGPMLKMNEQIAMAEKNFKTMQGSTNSSMTQMRKDLQSAQKQVETFQKTLEGLKKTTFVGAGIAFAGYEMAKGIEAGVSQAGEFLTKMIMIQDTVGATANQMNQIQKVIRSSSGTTIFGIDQTSDMALKLASSGLSAPQIQQTLPIFSQYAEVQKLGKGTDPTEAITQAISSAHIVGAYTPEALSSFLNQFNKATFMQPGTSSEFSDTFKYLAPSMQALHASTNDTLLTAALANRIGFLGSMGGTNAADAILRSIPGLFGGRGKTPSAQMVGLQQLGLDKTIFNNNGQFLGIANFVTQLQKASAGKNPMEITRLYHSIFGQQGMKIADVLSSSQGQDALSAIVTQMGSMKSIGQMQEDTNQSPAGQIMQLQTNLQNLKLSVFLEMAKALNPVFKSLNSIVSKVQDFADKHPQLAKLASDFALAATAAALIVGPLMMVTGALGYLGKSQLLSTGFGMLGKSFMGMLGPLTLAGSASYLLYQAWTTNFGGIQDKTKSVVDWVTQEVGKLKSLVDPVLQSLGIEKVTTTSVPEKAGKKILGYHDEQKKSFQVPHWAEYVAGAMVGGKTISGVSKGVGRMFNALHKAGGSGILKGMGRLVESGARMMFGDVPVSAVKHIGKWTGKVGGHVVKGLGKGAKGIGGLGKMAGQGIASAITKIPSVAASAGSALAKFGSTAAKVGGQAISAVGRLGVTVGKFAIQLAAQAVRMAASWLVAMGPIGWIVMGVIAVIGLLWLAWHNNWGNIRQHVKDTVDWIKNHFNMMIDWFKGLPDTMATMGTNIVHGLLNGIQGAWGWLKSEWNKLVDMIPGGLGKKLEIHSPSRVMMQMGGHIASGLALGMTKNAHLVDLAASSLASSAQGGGVGSGYALTGGSRSGGSVNNYSDNYNFNITINQQPGQDAKSLARDVYQEFGRMLRNDGRKSGAKPRNAW